MSNEQRWDALFEREGNHFNYGPCPCPRHHQEPKYDSIYLGDNGFGLICSPYLQYLTEYYGEGDDD